MENLSMKISKSTSRELINVLIPEGTPEDAIIELEITIEDKNINIREFGAYLTFIDKIYGRLHPNGIYSYSHRRNKQIQISEIREGSLELIIAEQLQAIDVDQILILWLVLKYLPNTLKQFTGAYKDYEDARLSRVNRKLIEEQISKDSKLKNVDSRNKRRLVEIIDYFTDSYIRYVPSVVRFNKKAVKDIKLSVKSKKKR